MAYHCSEFNAHCLLGCRDNSTRTFFSAKPLRPCIKVKVINISMSVYAILKSTIMPRLNAIAEIVSEILLLKYELKDVNWEMQL